jgi:hypothetical protein
VTRAEARYWLVLQLAAVASGIWAGVWLFGLISA